MSGESPREEKVLVWNCRAGAERPYQVKEEGDTVTAAIVRQTSRQQVIECRPLGQHDL